MYRPPPRRPIHLLLCLVTCLVSLVSSLGWAEEEATVEIARQRFREGVEFYDQREYEKARLAFLQAYALKAHPAVLLNLAQSELRAGYPADAANHFAMYLRENQDVSEGERQEAELGFAAARSKSGEVVLEVDTEGAQIFVDDELKGLSPLGGPLYVMPGSHTIEAKKGERSGATTVNVAAGQSTSASIALAAAAPAAGGPGTTGGPGGGAPGEGPGAGGDVAADFEADTGGRRPFFQWFGETPGAWVLAGVAVVGVAGGAVFAISAKSDFDSADDIQNEIIAARDEDAAPDPVAMRPALLSEDQGPCALDAQQKSDLNNFYRNRNPPIDRVAQYDQACALFSDRVDEAENKRLIAIAGFAVAGAAAIGTVIYYLLDSDSTDTGHRRPGTMTADIIPFATPTSQGINVVGRF